MKTILLLLSNNRYATPLIRYLVLEGKRYGWRVCIGSMFENTFTDRMKEEKICSDVIFIAITDFRQCDQAIRKSDLVIAIVPDVMLLQVADCCIYHQRPLISPAKLNRQMFAKKMQAEENKTLVLMECGFTYGLDHITAKNAIDTIHAKSGKISSFKTYSGSLFSESCIDNPWGFNLTEPVADIINIGKGNNRHLVDNHLQYIPHHALFSRSEPIIINGLTKTSVIPEGDALYFKKIYELPETKTIIRGRVLRDSFGSIWDIIVRLGFTNTTLKIDLESQSFVRFLSALLPYSPSYSLEDRLRKYTMATDEDIYKLKWLGLFDEEWLEGYREVTPAVILQHLLEKKFTPGPADKDCIVMRHEFEYSSPDHIHTLTATLVAEGEDFKNSALAKAIGLMLGAAAKSVLLENIKLRGLHTPVRREIHDPVLSELVDLGVAFHLEERKRQKITTSEAILIQE